MYTENITGFKMFAFRPVHNIKGPFQRITNNVSRSLNVIRLKHQHWDNHQSYYSTSRAWYSASSLGHRSIFWESVYSQRGREGGRWSIESEWEEQTKNIWRESGQRVFKEDMKAFNTILFCFIKGASQESTIYGHLSFMDTLST